MKIRFAVFGTLLVFVLLLTMAAVAATGGSGEKTSSDKTSGKDAPAAAAAGTHSTQDDTMRLAGEKRFRSNCARCHVAPPKFSPRMVGTIVRHMRVRATITEQDMRLILHYMSE
jgi:mono/diheme cytochrome c family protein